MKKFAALAVIVTALCSGTAFAQYAFRADGVVTPKVVKVASNIDKLDAYAQANPDKLSAIDSFGFNALHYAAQDGNLKAVVFLAEHNINLNTTAQYGFTPVYLAALRGNFDVVEYLISRGADIDTQVTQNGKKVSAYQVILNTCVKYKDMYKYQKVLKAYRKAKIKSDTLKKQLNDKEAAKKLSASINTTGLR